MMILGGVLAFLLGSIVGSFVNVLIFRFGFYESPRHRSACQGCEAPLRWFELIPILSFFFIRGRCLSCGSKLSVQYPIVEVSVGVLFLLSYLLFFPLYSPWFLGAFIFFIISLTTLFAAVVYDLRHTLIPFPFSWAFIGGAFLYKASIALATLSSNVILDGVFGVLIGGAIIGGIVLLTRGRGMGVGDIYIAVGMGALLGVSGILNALILSFWIGAIVGVSLVLLKRFSPHSTLLLNFAPRTIKSELPFVPFLFAGTLLALFTNVSAFHLIDTLVLATL